MTSKQTAYETAHAQFVREHAAECALFLKRSGDFPVSPCTINLYGSGARRTVKGGKGSGDVNVRTFTTIEQGLKDAGFTIMTEDWLTAYDRVAEENFENFYNDLKAQAAQWGMPPEALLMFTPKPPVFYDIPLTGEGELNLYVIARDSSEGTDRQAIEGDYFLSQCEVNDILTLSRRKEKLLVVLNTGAPVDLSPIMEVKNILLLGQLGAETGHVFADLLTGKSYPSGKLAQTWAGAYENYPSAGSFGTKNEVDYREGVFVGYRYFESFSRPVLFPFGFGLGYTDFTFFPMIAQVQGRDVLLTVAVKNVGSCAGKEVIQVYHALEGNEGPHLTLAGFAKSKELAAGEGETLTLTVRAEDFAVWRENAWRIPAGRHLLYVGNCLDNLICACALNVEKEVIVRETCSLGGKDVETLPPPPERHEDEPLLAEFAFSPAFPEKPAFNECIDPALEQLPDEELVRLTIGTLNEMSLTHNIGSSSHRVAGAAGETYAAANLPALVLADGPAGLRLSTRYRRAEDGGEIALDDPLAGMRLTGQPREDGEDVLYRYMTAIPVGASLAQSWNRALCEGMGSLVGREMTLFGVDIWLAPALNIQRDPLCGRNFEYLSEDPLLSGCLAAAIVRGVQKIKGRSATVKHFLCNNQETDRTFSSSNLSERTLRELYLKGFEICIRESHPDCVMSSYNLVNGVHTAESRAFLTDVLRKEWGFKGLVMTDWLSTGGMGTGEKYGPATPRGCIAAGNDLIMPGRREDFEDIMAALNEGALSRCDLLISASRVAALAKKKEEV